MSRGLRLLRRYGSDGGEGSGEHVRGCQPTAHAGESSSSLPWAAGPPPAGPAASPVPSGWHEVYAAVHPGVGDVTLAGDKDLFLQVPLILFTDVA